MSFQLIPTAPWFVVLAASIGSIGVAQSAPKRPNVILILPDQWRAQALGCAGDPNVQTPNLDRIAAESVNCVNAVASMPVCCPARAALLTGQRPLTTGVFMNDVPLRPKGVTLGEAMRNAGYSTGYIGKWHLNGSNRSADVPRDRRFGFDYWKAADCTHDYNHSLYYANDGVPRHWQGYDAIAQTRDAIEYLARHAKSEHPFFLVLAWGPPHSPYDTAPEPYRVKYDATRITLRPNVPAREARAAREMLANYYAHCSALDDCVGEIRAALAKLGLEGNTLLIFTSDHGDLLGSHAARNKQQPYDESIRIPLLLHWPAGLAPARRDAVIGSEDLMPTILGLCGVALPSGVEGLDYSGYLRGGSDPSDGAALISCVMPFGQWSREAGGKEYRGLRTLRYTYVRDLHGPWLLFDDERDPYQQRNLARDPEYAALQAELDRRFTQKLAAAHDEFLPGEAYLRRWGYAVDRTGTVPYRD